MGIKTIPWTYVRQRIPVGTSGVSTCQADMLFKEDNLQPAPRLKPFLGDVGSLDKSRRSEVSVDEYEVQRKKPVCKREEKQRPMFFFGVYVVGWSLFKDPQFDHCRRS